MAFKVSKPPFNGVMVGFPELHYTPELPVSPKTVPTQFSRCVYVQQEEFRSKARSQGAVINPVTQAVNGVIPPIANLPDEHGI